MKLKVSHGKKGVSIFTSTYYSHLSFVQRIDCLDGYISPLSALSIIIGSYVPNILNFQYPVVPPPLLLYRCPLLV